jgi:hypothetical protein
VLGRRRPHLPLPKLGGSLGGAGLGVSGRASNAMSPISSPAQRGDSWRAGGASPVEVKGKNDEEVEEEDLEIDSEGHVVQHEDYDGAVAVLTSPGSGSGAQPAGDVLEQPASLTALPQLNTVIAACWQQRELRRPTAVEAHAALQRLGVQLAGGWPHVFEAA